MRTIGDWSRRDTETGHICSFRGCRWAWVPTIPCAPFITLPELVPEGAVATSLPRSPQARLASPPGRAACSWALQTCRVSQLQGALPPKSTRAAGCAVPGPRPRGLGPERALSGAGCRLSSSCGSLAALPTLSPSPTPQWCVREDAAMTLLQLVSDTIKTQKRTFNSLRLATGERVVQRAQR